MANTYTQLIIQIIFAVQGRQNLIKEVHRDEIEKYMCGIISNKGYKPLAIYCNPDHCHILIGLHPSVSISDTARDIKANSSRWINEKSWINGKFEWQKGFGAFSYSRSQIDVIVKYILNQPNHHKIHSFKDEYIGFLKENDIDFKNEYIFEFLI